MKEITRQGNLNKAMPQTNDEVQVAWKIFHLNGTLIHTSETVNAELRKRKPNCLKQKSYLLMQRPEKTLNMSLPMNLAKRSLSHSVGLRGKGSNSWMGLWCTNDA